MSGNNPVSLVLTNEQSLYADGSKRLLGRWCIDFSGSLESIRAAESLVLPYPFDEPSAYDYLQRVDQRLFPLFAERMNKYHHLHKSDRYWRIVTGYWWREFMEIVYERYVCITRAASMYPDASVKVLDGRHWVTPLDSKDFGALYKTDAYNHQLYSQLIACGGYFHVEALTDKQRHLLGMDTLPLIREGGLNRLKDWMCRLSRWNKQYFASTYLLNKSLCHIALKLKCFPTLDTPRLLLSQDRSIERYKRASFSTLQGMDAFENTLIKLLSINIPKCYLEDYPALANQVHRRFPTRPMKSIVTANAFAYNEGFKVFTAEQTELFHTPFIILQHGGQYGCAAWHSSEDYEKEIADYYLTYGWHDAKNQNVRPFIANRFQSPRVEANRKPDGHIIWVMASFPRYSYTMYAVPAGPRFVDYLNDQAAFMMALPVQVRNKIKARLYRHTYGWHDADYLEKMIGSPLQISNIRLSLPEEASRSSLVVCTYNATAHLEMFALNVPTILYWDPKHWPLRDEAEPLHQQLREAGILYNDPVAAAAKVADIYPNVLEWWQGEVVQKARKAFCEQYAATSPNYTEEWLQIFADPQILSRRDTGFAEAAHVS